MKFKIPSKCKTTINAHFLAQLWSTWSESSKRQSIFNLDHLKREKWIWNAFVINPKKVCKFFENWNNYTELIIIRSDSFRMKFSKSVLKLRNLKGRFFSKNFLSSPFFWNRISSSLFQLQVFLECFRLYYVLHNGLDFLPCAQAGELKSNCEISTR